MLDRTIPPNALLHLGIGVAVGTMRGTKNLLQHNEGILSETSSKTDNVARKIDLFAELSTESDLLQRYRNGLRVLGEEKLKDQTITLHGETRVVALLDMIDGTDLVYRKLSNWCSALVFFDPQEKKILASVVGLPSGSFYCAAFGGAPSYIVKVTSRAQEVPREQLSRRLPIRPSRNTKLGNAAVCFYGQKAENFFSLMGEGSSFPNYLK